MEEGRNDKRAWDLLTKHSYHQNITVMSLCQDMFPPGKYAKCISRNTHYIIVSKNPNNPLIRDAKSFAESLSDTIARRTRHVLMSARTSIRLHDLGFASQEQ